MFLLCANDGARGWRDPPLGLCALFHAFARCCNSRFPTFLAKSSLLRLIRSVDCDQRVKEVISSNPSSKFVFANFDL